VLFSEPKIPQSDSAPAGTGRPRVSVLFSEPKIPQYLPARLQFARDGSVSVLFSEPKIPQWHERAGEAMEIGRFSALQRAENSSMQPSPARRRARRVSVLFSEPKIPQ